MPVEAAGAPLPSPRRARAIQPDRLARLGRMLNPASVAVAGGEVAAELIRQCRKIGFRGQIWPINPRRDHIEGIPTYPSVDALPAPPDAAFIAVNRDETIPMVAALARRGASGAVCYASGFAEIGGEGIELQKRLVEAAGDMALLGPNCYGAINYLDGCALWPDRLGGGRVERGVAILTQSGNIALNLTMQGRHLPIAYVIVVGNRAVSDIHDCIAALLNDDRVSAIGLHLEGLTDVAAFSEVARAALLKNVPIVVLKAGSSDLGAQLTASHTSSLAGPEVLYAALFDRFGIARVEDPCEFLETLKLLHACGPLKGARVGSLSCSGGDAAMVADLGHSHRLDFPKLSAQVTTELSNVLGPRVPISNPLDYHTYIWGDERALADCFGAMMSADHDVTLIVLDFPPPDFPSSDGAIVDGWEQVLSGFVAAHQRRGGPAIMVSSMPELMPQVAAQRLLSSGIAPMQGLRETVVAIAAGARIGARQREASQIEVLPAPVALRSGPAPLLDEMASKAALQAFGLRIPAFGRAAGAGEAVSLAAVSLAESIGYPVVVKAVSASLAHKTEQDAVKLNLINADQVRHAIGSLSQRFDCFLVEKMITGALAELIVGVTRDSQFGLALTIGAGGVLVELLSDSVTLLLPARRNDIERALRSLRCFTLLDGYRGRPRAKLEQVVDAIEAIASFAWAHADRLQELDVNPLIVTAAEVVAADALVRMVL
jgi:acyl-CoA synthetase (NDP forming)